MKAHLEAQLQSVSDPVQARNFVREYLQALILNSLQRSGAMVPLAFHGGTALRFLYAIQRFSEDLDFALEGDRSGYDFRVFLQAIRTDLEAQGYNLELKVSDQKTVHSAFVRFPGLLFDLSLSPHVDQVLAVKIEVDTHPPQGAGVATTIIRRHQILNLQHHDQPSLFAGKLHAILQRSYLKGRDLYDLLWYLSDPEWPPPNLVMLNHALQQTGWQGTPLNSQNWRAVVLKRLKRVDWTQMIADVRPFVENLHELDHLTYAVMEQLLQGKP